MLIKLLTEALKGRQNSSAKRDKYSAPPGECQFLTETRKGRENSSAKHDKYGGQRCLSVLIYGTEACAMSNALIVIELRSNLQFQENI